LDGDDDDLAPLRSILVGPEQRRLERLQARVEDPAARAADVSAVLPQALLLSGDDADLARALTPPVERAITASVRRDPQPIADALFPVMGPAIRKAVASSLAAMIESLNRTLEQGLSWRSLRWRFEAMRTGKPFAEIVLLKTLLYRVEQVFLIERASGLLLQHVRAGPAPVQDAEMVSGMLTAIRDFVQDSFRESEHASLDAFQVGALVVWVEQGPRAIIAAVIRGTPPQEVRRALQHAVETIHLQFADELAAFDGDASVFDASRAALDGCLVTQYRSEARARPRMAWIALGILLLGLVAWGALWFRERARWTSYVDALQAEPGLVVVSAARSGGRYFVSGLRDPLARDPEQILRASNLSPGTVTGRWQPYQALEPRFVLARAREALRPPRGVTLDLRDGVLSVSGRAPATWIAEARRLAPLVAGVRRLDATGPLNAEIQSAVERIGKSTVLFGKGTARLAAGQDDVVRNLALEIGRLDTLAGAAGGHVRIEIVGHTDADGASDSNLPLSRARAEHMRTLLGTEAAPHIEMVATGIGSSQPAFPGVTEAEKQQNRRVSFRVIAAGSPDAGGVAR
jgi:OOP family OmpA-OmpF porin